MSRTRIQDAANAGNILVNNSPVKPNYRVKPSDVVQIVLPNRVKLSLLLRISPSGLYEDDDVIVVNKAPGMVVHPAYGNYSEHWLMHLCGISGTFRFSAAESSGPDWCTGLIHIGTTGYCQE